MIARPSSTSRWCVAAVRAGDPLQRQRRHRRAAGRSNFVGLENFSDIVGTRRSSGAREHLRLRDRVAAWSSCCANILALALRGLPGEAASCASSLLLPWVAPISLGTIGWMWILDSIYSVINWTLAHLGISAGSTWPMWLGQPNLAMASVIAVHVWRMMPLATVISWPGSPRSPREIHDAAAVDGAGFWRHLFRSPSRSILPIMLVAVLFGLVFTFTDMIVIYVLTRAARTTRPRSWPASRSSRASRAGDLAEGAAIAMFLFPLLLAVARHAARRAPHRGDLRWRDGRPAEVAGGAGHSGDRARRSPACSRSPSTWMLITTFKQTSDLLNPRTTRSSTTRRPPSSTSRVLFEDTLFFAGGCNTRFVGVLVVAITLVLAVPGGYSLARLTGGWGAARHRHLPHLPGAAHASSSSRCRAWSPSSGFRTPSGRWSWSTRASRCRSAPGS